MTRHGGVVVAVAFLGSCGSDDSRQSDLCALTNQVLQNSPAAVNLTKKSKSNEVLVAATRKLFPLTKRQVDIGKYLNAATKKIDGRAYSLNGVLEDHVLLEQAEQAKHRSTSGPWSNKDFNYLKKNASSASMETATLWVRTSAMPYGNQVSVSNTISKDKAAVRTLLATVGLAEVWDDPLAPVIVVGGTPSQLQILTTEASIARAHIHSKTFSGGVLGVPVDGQEQIDMGLGELKSNFGDYTASDITHWDGCLPSDAVTKHDASKNWMLYIPLGQKYTVTPPTSSPCHSSDPTFAFNQTHADRTLGIVSGRKDATNGFASFLPNLAAINIATVLDLSTETALMNRIATVAASQPLVQSWSAFMNTGSYVFCSGIPETYMVYADWKSLQYPSLNIYAAGNYAEIDSWSSNALCDTPDYIYTTFKQRNGIHVGAYYDGNSVPTDNTMYQKPDPVQHMPGLDDYSAWRSPYGGEASHGDRRLPHVVAVGTYVQSFDDAWRASPSNTPPSDPPYVRCDKPTDQSTMAVFVYGQRPVVGSSFAAPQGAVLGAYAMRQTTCIYPSDRQKALQLARAIMLVSATRKVTVRPTSSEQCGGSPCPIGQYRLTTGIARWNERRWAAGAGGLDAGMLGHVMHRDCRENPGTIPAGAAYGGDDVYFPTEGLPGTIPPKKPSTSGRGNRRCRVALAWNPLPNCTGYNCTESVGFDFDVCLFVDSTSELLGCAASWDNNYEFLDVDCPGGKVMRIEAYAYAGTGGQTAKLAWAFVDTDLP